MLWASYGLLCMRENSGRNPSTCPARPECRQPPCVRKEEGLPPRKYSNGVEFGQGLSKHHLTSLSPLVSCHLHTGLYHTPGPHGVSSRSEGAGAHSGHWVCRTCVVVLGCHGRGEQVPLFTGSRPPHFRGASSWLWDGSGRKAFSSVVVDSVGA